MRPNILLILADDIGYECLGVNGGESYKTPNLDNLAKTGMRFDHAYVQPLCTPTRVEIMTGQSNVRNYIGFGKINPNDQTFASLLKQAGYSTCMVGKWQLGKSHELPRQVGFDEALLWQHALPRKNGHGRDTRYRDPVLEKNGQVVTYPADSYGPDEVANYACDFMQRHKDGPFLIYYTDILPHWPFVPTPDSKDWNSSKDFKNFKENPRYFADMVSYMDKSVGKLVAKLDELGIRDNTLTIFIGDNGTDDSIRSMWRGQQIQGGKGSTTRAGMHVPMIANWPGVIPAGTVCDELVNCTDFLPTFCEIAAAPLPQGVPFDGASFLPMMRGEKCQPREWIYCWYAPTLANLLELAFDKRFKLYTDGRFYDMDVDPLEQSPLDDARLDNSASAAKAKLSVVLNQFKAARPGESATSACKRTRG
jgi:arylsulfatase A